MHNSGRLTEHGLRCTLSVSTLEACDAHIVCRISWNNQTNATCLHFLVCYVPPKVPHTMVNLSLMGVLKAFILPQTVRYENAVAKSCLQDHRNSF